MDCKRGSLETRTEEKREKRRGEERRSGEERAI